MNEHDNRILRPKNKPADDREALAEYARSHHWCAACGADHGAMQVHHIIGGRGGRADEPCNLLRLCAHPCHDLAGGLDVRRPGGLKMEWNDGDLECHPYYPKLTLGIQISFKLRMGELDAANLERLAVLHGRTLPHAEPIPKLFVELFLNNRPELVGRTWPILASNL